MRDWEICHYCKKFVNGVYDRDKNTICNGYYCHNSVDDEDTCNTFICNFCIRWYFHDKYEVCHFCKLPVNY